MGGGRKMFSRARPRGRNLFGDKKKEYFRIVFLHLYDRKEEIWQRHLARENPYFLFCVVLNTLYSFPKEK